MAPSEHEDRPLLGFEDWEAAAIEYWARRVWEPSDQKELRAELARKLLVLHAEPRLGIRHRKAYLRTAIANAAKAWLKKRNAAKPSLQPEPWSTGDFEEPAPHGFHELGRDEGDFGLAFRQFWDELGPDLQRFLRVLEEKKWNLSAVAKTLRIHRNTATLWLKKVRLQAMKHGLGGD